MRILFLVWSSYPQDKLFADPSVWYRCYQPADAMRKQGVHVNVVHYESVSGIPGKYDFVIFFRPRFSEEFIYCFNKFSEAGSICIASYDDLFFDIKHLRQSNFRELTAPQIQILQTRPYNYAAALYFFDSFIASTDSLRESIRRAKPDGNTHVLYNAIPPDVMSLAKKISQKRPSGKGPRRIGYFAGGSSHSQDLVRVSQSIAKVLREEDAEFFCVETVPIPEVIEATGKVVKSPRLSYMGMIEAYSTCKATIAPLEINEFTKAKSGIKSLEASVTGSICVASPIPDVERVGGDHAILVDSLENWVPSLQEALNREQTPDVIEAERARIEKSFTTEIEGKSLLGFLENLKKQTQPASEKS